MSEHKLIWQETHNGSRSHTIKARCECGWEKWIEISTREALERGVGPFELGRHPLQRAFNKHLEDIKRNQEAK